MKCLKKTVIWESLKVVTETLFPMLMSTIQDYRIQSQCTVNIEKTHSAHRINIALYRMHPTRTVYCTPHVLCIVLHGVHSTCKKKIKLPIAPGRTCNTCGEKNSEIFMLCMKNEKVLKRQKFQSLSRNSKSPSDFCSLPLRCSNRKLQISDVIDTCFKLLRYGLMISNCE